jgi:hypothetical protein
MLPIMALYNDLGIRRPQDVVTMGGIHGTSMQLATLHLETVDSSN